MEAVYEFFGGTATSLEAASAVGDTTINTVATLPVGVVVEVDVLGDGENVVVKSVSGSGPYAVVLSAPLKYAHAAGAIVATYKTQPCIISGIKTVVRGEPFDVPDKDLPILYITVPKSQEYRFGGTSKIQGMAQKKGIDYVVRLMLGALMNGPGVQDQGAILLNEFYEILDAIGVHLRGGDLAVPNNAKVLVTTNFPNGAAVRFGEDFTVQEMHDRAENTLKAVTQIETTSTEMVNA
ncbi:MAG: hypothetical protein ACYCOR_10845 [Acidobacteriaceae bacterium]